MVRIPVEAAESHPDNRAYKKKVKDWKAINKEMQEKECSVCHQVGTLKPCDDLQPGEYLIHEITHISIYCESCKVMQRFPIRHITFPNYPKVELP